MVKSYAIKTQDLTKRFGSLVAVNKVNLEIPYGKTYGLLGPNGAGKTTTVRILNTIISKTSGNASISGYDIVTESKKIRMLCGFLPESPGLYSKLTAREFLTFMGELYYLPKDVISDRVGELLHLFDLEDRENDLLESFSRGMKQKICLCAALIQDPKIIFLDEPTSNLDPAVARMVKNLIQQLAKKADKTIFICTHLLDVAEELCDIIGIIIDGELKAEGTPEELIASVGANNLEDAYLKITGAEQTEDLLSWRENSKTDNQKELKRKKIKNGG
jgi:ABC-2 type transport system ATP-binding protein